MKCLKNKLQKTNIPEYLIKKLNSITESNKKKYYSCLSNKLDDLMTRTKSY